MKISLTVSACITFLVVVIPLQAQNADTVPDSLLTAVALAPNDSLKVVALNNLAFEYLRQGSYEKSHEYAHTSMTLAEKLNFKLGLSKACNTIGMGFHNQGNPIEALPYYEKAMALNQALGDKQRIANSYRNIGRAQVDNYLFADGIDNHLKAAMLWKELGNKAEEGDSYTYIGMAYTYYLQDFTKAIDYFNLALALQNEIGNKTEISQILGNLGIAKSGQGDFDGALHDYLASLEILEEVGDRWNMVNANINIGSLYANQGKYKEALKAQLNALQLAKELDDKQQIFSAYNNMSMTYKLMGNPLESLNCLLLALNIARETGVSSDIIMAYSNISIMYTELKRYDEALKNIEDAKFYCESQKDEINLADLNRLEADICFRKKDYETALIYVQKALPCYEKHGLKLNLAEGYIQLALILLALDIPEEAQHYIDTSIIILTEIGYQHRIAGLYGSIASLYSDQNKIEEAIRYYRLGLEYAEEYLDTLSLVYYHNAIGDILCRQAATQHVSGVEQIYQEAHAHYQTVLNMIPKSGEMTSELDVYRGLSKAYEGLGDYEKALTYQTSYFSLKDSLYNNENTQKLEQLRTQFEVEKAVAMEKFHQDSLLTEQKFLSEKEQAEINARHEIAIAEAKAQKQKAIEVANIRYQMAMAEAKTEQDKQLAEQKFQSELKLAEENSRHQIALADERSKEETEREKRRMNSEKLMAGFGLFGLIALFFFLYNRQRNLKRRAIEKADNQHKMAELELQSLRAQLNPHFMFNSLNAIQELILMEENDKSHTYLARFAKLLRMLLENANSPFIPLAREIEFLQLYLSLENLRIPDLKYNIQVDPNINTEHIKIPNMILQPYIENAIWHGLSHKQGDKNLQLKIGKQNGSTVYEIEDNGVGRQKAEEMKSLYRKEHKSKGMELLTKRFKLLHKEYGSEIKTSVTDVIKNNEIGGTRVSINVPASFTTQPETIQVN